MDHVTGIETPERLYDRGLATSGIACALSGITGGIGTAPFAISAGLVSVTREESKRGFLMGAGREESKRGFLMGAGLFILMGVIPPLGQFFGSIPVPIASAVLLVSVSSLAVIGLQTAIREPLDGRGSLVVGLGLLVGSGMMFVPGSVLAGAPYWLSSVLSNGVITGTIVAIVLEQTILRKKLH
jgi:xanthine/uracil permease